MQIFPGIHEIRSVLGGRRLQQYLFVGESVVFVDAGVYQTPARVIFPYFETIGLSPQRLAMVIGMHADIDHQVGCQPSRTFHLLRFWRAMTVTSRSSKTLTIYIRTDTTSLLRDTNSASVPK